jgi:hypothetical protein
LQFREFDCYTARVSTVLGIFTHSRGKVDKAVCKSRSF